MGRIFCFALMLFGVYAKQLYAAQSTLKAALNALAEQYQVAIIYPDKLVSDVVLPSAEVPKAKAAKLKLQS